jgi:hypothetical protein
MKLATIAPDESLRDITDPLAYLEAWADHVGAGITPGQVLDLALAVRRHPDSWRELDKGHIRGGAAVAYARRGGWLARKVGGSR